MKKNKNQETQPSKFPKPRTFPSAWDGDALMETNGHPINEDMVKPRALTDEDPNYKPEKFPKPRTHPRCWSIDD